MKVRSPLALLILVSLSAGHLLAQNQNDQPTEKKKLYRWVDKDGRVQISDQLPPEAVNQAHKEINSKGRSTNVVERTLTEAERVAQAQQAIAQEKAQKAVDQQKRIEDAMLINYTTEDDLRRTYKERIDLLQQTIESTDISIRSIRSSLIGMLTEASEAELAGHAISDGRTKQIQVMHSELLKQQTVQVESRNNVKLMENEFFAVLARYRELRSATRAISNTAHVPQQ